MAFDHKTVVDLSNGPAAPQIVQLTQDEIDSLNANATAVAAKRAADNAAAAAAAAAHKPPITKTIAFENAAVGSIPVHVADGFKLGASINNFFAMSKAGTPAGGVFVIKRGQSVTLQTDGQGNVLTLTMDIHGAITISATGETFTVTFTLSGV
jgi:hypothetical protein